MTTTFAIARDWRGRFRAGGRFLLFTFLFFCFFIFSTWLSRGLVAKIHGFVFQILAGDSLVTGSVLLATLLLARVEKRSVWEFGFGGPQRLRLLGLGAALGALMVSLLIATLWLAGGLMFVHHADSLSAALKNGLAYGLLFFLVAVSEESLWRGYALASLSKAISFWPAVVVLSTLFALSHANNHDETFIGLFFAAIFSLVLSYSFLRFGSLWLAIGLHAAWDYGQSFVFGVPDSGVIVPGSFMVAKITGPTWLTGGPVGPEGSLLMPIVFILIALEIKRIMPRPPGPPSDAN